MKLSMCRASLAGMYSSMLKPFTSPANWHAMLLASKRVTVAMPERPARILAQPSATLLPTGLIRPRPVTTTRRRVMQCGSESCKSRRPRGLQQEASGLLVLDGVVDRQLHGGDLLGLFVRDLDAELVFEGHHQFHGVQRIGAQVGNESLFVRDVGFRHAELLGDDFLDSCFDIAHDSSRRGLQKTARHSTGSRAAPLVQGASVAWEGPQATGIRP
mmetsp:Transcript_1253/g.3603  ORF Transcript_1253/g.3603 Transcript_1253/m.3603 type:complete len:215 (+) Transcript_1253:610-1254(+)